MRSEQNGGKTGIQFWLTAIKVKIRKLDLNARDLTGGKDPFLLKKVRNKRSEERQSVNSNNKKEVMHLN